MEWIICSIANYQDTTLKYIFGRYFFFRSQSLKNMPYISGIDFLNSWKLCLGLSLVILQELTDETCVMNFISTETKTIICKGTGWLGVSGQCSLSIGFLFFEGIEREHWHGMR